jgi:hypothetical protein
MAGISSASSAGAAKKVAKDLSRFGIGGTFMRSYCVGFLGAAFKGGKKAENDEALMAKARELGKKVASGIKTSKRYLLQGLPKRILNCLMMRPLFGAYIKNNKDGEAKILFENLKKRNLLT